jgi:hypothetical protein
MDKQEIVTQVANDILHKMNINEIVNVARGFAIQKAEEYYASLTDDQRSDIEAQILEAKQTAQKQNEEVAEATPV